MLNQKVDIHTDGRQKLSLSQAVIHIVKSED